MGGSHGRLRLRGVIGHGGEILDRHRLAVEIALRHFGSRAAQELGLLHGLDSLGMAIAARTTACGPSPLSRSITKLRSIFR